MQTLKIVLRFLINHKKGLLYSIVGLAVISILVFSDYGVLKKMELQKQKRLIIQNTENQKKLKDSLLQRIQLISNDKYEVEKIARKNYGLVKPHENVYIVRQKQGK